MAESKLFKMEYAFVILIIYFILFLLKINHLNLPYYWDDIYPYVSASIYSATHGLTPLLYGIDASHPPLFPMTLASFFLTFGIKSTVARIMMIIFAGLSVFLTYVIGRKFFNPTTGIISSLLLISTPLFLSQSSIPQITVLETTLFLVTFYFFLSKRYVFFSISCSLLLLTKEIFIFVPFLSLFMFIHTSRFDIKKIFLILSPFFIFLLWMLSNKYIYGWFLAPYSAGIIHSSPLYILANFLLISKYLFFDDFRWILSFIVIILPAIDIKKLMYSINFKKILKALAIFLSLFSIFYLFSLIFNKYFPMIFKNFSIYLLEFDRFKLLFSLSLTIILLSFKKVFSFWTNKKYLTIILFIFSGIILSSFFPWLPRYSLFIIPLYLILSANILSKRISNKYLLISLVLVLIFFSVYSLNGNRENIGFWLENNYEFLDYIKVRQEASDYLVDKHLGKSILASYPEFFDLSYIWVGYIDIEKPFRLEGINYYEFSEIGRSIFQEPFGTDFNDRRVTRTINDENNYEIIYINKSAIDWNNIDLVYYSPQSYNLFFSSLEELKTERNLDIKLLKKFSSNGKYVEIYEVEQNNNHSKSL